LGKWHYQGLLTSTAPNTCPAKLTPRSVPFLCPPFLQKRVRFVDPPATHHLCPGAGFPLFALYLTEILVPPFPKVLITVSVPSTTNGVLLGRTVQQNNFSNSISLGDQPATINLSVPFLPFPNMVFFSPENFFGKLKRERKR